VIILKKLVLKPDGWPCLLIECPPGLFVFKDSVCMKSDYRTDKGELEAFNEAGEFFWGGVETYAEREKLIVQPVTSEWVDEEE
jgi:hypothetical protein